jgi:hypothetical protein
MHAVLLRSKQQMGRSCLQPSYQQSWYVSQASFSAMRRLTCQKDFHADRFNGDVLAMYIRHPGNNNEGQQYVASFAMIYNQLLAKHPQTLQVLGNENWPFVAKAR